MKNESKEKKKNKGEEAKKNTGKARKKETKRKGHSKQHNAPRSLPLSGVTPHQMTKHRQRKHRTKEAETKKPPGPKPPRPSTLPPPCPPTSYPTPEQLLLVPPAVTPPQPPSHSLLSLSKVSVEVAKPTGTSASTLPSPTALSQRPSNESINQENEKTRRLHLHEVMNKKNETKGGSKVSRLLSWKWQLAEADFTSHAAILPSAVSRFAFDHNMHLNRFSDIICVDQTRVRVSTNEYVHANWVTAGEDRKRSIVAQLPVKAGAAAFWRMIAEHGINGILLILTREEALQSHAFHTFPKHRNSLLFSNSIIVTETNRVFIDAHWDLHVLLVHVGDIRRYVHVHCFYGWEHGGSPSLHSLWQLDSVFRRYQLPYVYVSLSGAGRAATFAAFQLAHRRLHDPSLRTVKVTVCVGNIREGRMHSVQSAEQLLTVHAALLAHVCDCPGYSSLTRPSETSKLLARFSLPTKTPSRLPSSAPRSLMANERVA